MKKTICKTLMIFAGAAFGLSAGTITFDQIAVTNNDIQSGTITTQGFDFTSSSFHTINNPAGCAGGCVDDGSQYLAVAGPSVDSPVTITTAGGQAFSLTSLDGGKLFLTPGGLTGLPNADTLDLMGAIKGGGTVSASLTLPAEGTFKLFSLSGFTDLTSVVIWGTGGGSTDASWAVDNLAATAIPEPSTLLLLTFAALVLLAGCRLRPSRSSRRFLSM